MPDLLAPHYPDLQGASQERLQGFENEYNAHAQSMNAGDFDTHWNNRIAGLDTGNVQKVQDFAATYGVKPGLISGLGAPPRPMGNDDLLAIAKQHARNQFHAANPAQPANVLATMNPAAIGRRLGMTPYQAQGQQAAVQNLQNTAQAVPMFAQGAADTGKGHLLAGQAEVDKARVMAPMYESEGNLNNAKAGNIAGMTPFQQEEAQASAAKTRHEAEAPYADPNVSKEAFSQLRQQAQMLEEDNRRLRGLLPKNLQDDGGGLGGGGLPPPPPQGAQQQPARTGGRGSSGPQTQASEVEAPADGAATNHPPGTIIIGPNGERLQAVTTTKGVIWRRI